MFQKTRTVSSAPHSAQRFFQRNWHYFVVAALSMSVFLLIYGVQVVNPTYTDWLLGKGDLSQHYIGWQAFRNGGWLFPIGMTDQLSYPYPASIIFTDSIPLFAVIFKLFRAVLPTEFQYFGLWGVLCFALQGVFAARLIQRFIPKRLYIILTSMLFLFTPVMIFRMFVHTALAGHWLILFALDAFFENKTVKGPKTYLRWAAIGALSVSVHLYFLLICGIVLAGCCLEEVIRTRRWLRAVFIGISYLLSALIVVALLGGFSSSMDASIDGLGMFSFNLNALFNPQGWSRILPSLPTYGTGQYEGLAYLGAGVLVLLALSLVAIAVSPKIRAGIRARRSQAIALCLIFIAALIAALSPIITLNQHVLLTLPLPRIIEKLWGIFRSSGRIGWLMVYLILFGAVILSYRFINRRSAVVLAAFVLCLQVYDIHDKLETLHEDFSPKIVFHSQLADSAFWDAVIQQDDIRHIVLVQRFAQFPERTKWSIADWAMDNKLTLNDYYFARENGAQFVENWHALLANPDASELFILSPDNAFETAALDLNYYMLDGLIVGTLEPIPGQARADISSYSTSRYTFFDGRVNNGEDRDGARYLFANGESFGPYWSLPVGTYQVVVSGSNLTQCDVVARSFSGGIRHEISALSAQDDQISFTVAIEKNTFSFEISVVNDSGEEVCLNYIDVTRLG